MMTRPVIVLGAPRAGTSVLGRLLEAHPKLVHVKEPRLVWRYGNDGLSDLLPPEAARPEVVAYIRKYFEGLLGDTPGARIIEKTPSNSLRVPFIEKVFPNAQYVHVMRDGYEAALSIHWHWHNLTVGVGQGRRGSQKSILRQRLEEAHPSQLPHYLGEFFMRLLPNGKGKPRTLWGPRLPGLRRMTNEMDLFEVAAWQWRMCVERACMDGRPLGPERYLEFYLDDLNEDRLESIFEFLDLDYAPEARAFFREEFEPAKNLKRRGMLDDLSAEQKHGLRRVVEPTASWLSGGQKSNSLVTAP